MTAIERCIEMVRFIWMRRTASLPSPTTRYLVAGRFCGRWKYLGSFQCGWLADPRDACYYLDEDIAGNVAQSHADYEQNTYFDRIAAVVRWDRTGLRLARIFKRKKDRT